MTLTAPRRRTIVPVARPRVAILTGGSPEDRTPRPLTAIGGRPILWHSMMHFARFGMTDFIVPLGQHGEEIKQAVLDCSDQGVIEEDWKVDLIDGGVNSMMAGRLRRVREHLGRGAFFLTNAESVSDVNLDDLLAYHRSHGRLATIVAVRPPARFGKLEMKGDEVVEFAEKPEYEQSWTSASLYVLNPGAFAYMGDDDNTLEEPLERLAQDGQLMAYKHASFWQGVETLRDRQVLEELWQAGNAPWMKWE